MNLIIELSALNNVSEIYFNYCSSNLTAHGNVEANSVFAHKVVFS